MGTDAKGPSAPAVQSRPAMRDAQQRARERLSSAYADDLLDADELDERLEALECAEDEAAVNLLVADLTTSPPASALVPVASTTAVEAVHRPARIVSLFSSTERRGHWSPGRHNTVTSVFGSAEIDLREASLPPEGIEIAVSSMFGSVEIFVPPGTPVELECVAVLGSAEQDEPSAAPDPAKPRVRVTGWVAFGSVEVRERLPGEGGWAARKRRKAAKKALRDAAAKKALSARH